MKLPVRTPEAIRSMTFGIADFLPAGLLREWSATLHSGSNGRQLDAVEFLESALGKWDLYEQKQRVAHSQEEFHARVRQEEKGELLGFLTASADWYRQGAIAGFCQFRRTWCNNIVFDFLGVHPSLLSPSREISGLGLALLYRLALVAKELQAGIVWAETTDTSCQFYASLFGLSALADLLVLPAETFLAPLASAIEGHGKVMY